jgi:ATP phosphoribosyltransferase regulatory subunit
MSNFADKALLPTGMVDVLPPDAEFEAHVVERLLASFKAYGYDQVKPPLIEFEESLLGTSGGAVANQTFRLMDPASQRMMGLRTDMTLQVARIGTTRMKKAARPLRLSYAGQVLRVKGSQLRPERQFGQVGVELIGSDNPASDAEVIVMAVEALNALGSAEISVDLGLPSLVSAVCSYLSIDDETNTRLQTTLDRKDLSGINALADTLGPSITATLSALLSAVGPVDSALKAVKEIDLSDAAAQQWQALVDTVGHIRQANSAISLTVDPVENRGFEYHSGPTFTLFARGVRGELGSGGRYRAGNGDTPGEPSTGLTLFMDTVLRSVTPPEELRRLYLLHGTTPTVAKKFRDEGWSTLQGLNETEDPKTEAMRLSCSHILVDGDARILKEDV